MLFFKNASSKGRNTIIQNFMRVCSIIAACLIFFLSSQSRLPTLPKPIFGLDKILHAFAFGSLAFTLSYWFSSQKWKEKPLFLFFIVFGIVALYGASDEIHQYFVPGRDTSIYDWFADCVGAVLALLLRLGINRKALQ